MPPQDLPELNQEQIILETYNASKQHNLTTKTLLSISIHYANKKWDSLTNQIIYQGED